MGTSSNIKNLILISAISSSAISLNYQNQTQKSAPSTSAKYNFEKKQSLVYHSVDDKTDYIINNRGNNQEIENILSFSKKLIEGSTEMDSEFVNIINENFWDLM